MSLGKKPLHRRTQRLEEEAAQGGEDVTFVLNLTCPVAESAGGGTKIEARSFAPPGTVDEAERVRYYFEPQGSEAGGGGEERKELTKEEYEALPRARHTLPESDPRHKPRHEQ